MSFGGMNFDSSFAGDFQFGDAFAGGFNSDMAMPTLAGDFYREDDNVTRGLSLYNDADQFMYRGDTDLLGKACMEAPLTWAKVPEQSSSTAVLRFLEEDEAMPVPEDEFFQLEQTRIVVSGMSAADVGNRMINFLGSEASGLISKVNRKKFTIKAEVCLHGLTCETKVRVYRHAFMQYIVEMQRRSGDTIAFHNLYKWAADRLSPNNLDVASASEAARPAPAPVPEVQHLQTAEEEDLLRPLFDLAESSGNRRLQAEAVQGLLQAASDVDLLVQMSTPQAFLIYKNLLQLVSYSVLEPLARLLCCLAAVPQAQPQFLDEQLLSAIVDRTFCESTAQATSSEMAQAVSRILTSHAAEVPAKAAQQLQATLTEKLNNGSADLPTVCYLQQSLQALMHVSPSRNAQACF
jgi:hypothetical protein